MIVIYLNMTCLFTRVRVKESHYRKGSESSGEQYNKGGQTFLLTGQIQEINSSVGREKCGMFFFFILSLK